MKFSGYFVNIYKKSKAMNNKYTIEACERYGNTEVCCEYAEKTKNYTKQKWVEAKDGLMAIFAGFVADAIEVYCRK